MGYRIRIHRRVINLIRGWNLPDRIPEEVDLFLEVVLPADPENNLIRETAPYDGMVWQFTRRDPDIRGREHDFIFHVFFSQDEEALLIERGSYTREDDG